MKLQERTKWSSTLKLKEARINWANYIFNDFKSTDIIVFKGSSYNDRISTHLFIKLAGLGKEEKQKIEWLNLWNNMVTEIWRTWEYCKRKECMRGKLRELGKGNFQRNLFPSFYWELSNPCSLSYRRAVIQ